MFNRKGISRHTGSLQIHFYSNSKNSIKLETFNNYYSNLKQFIAQERLSLLAKRNTLKNK